MEPFDSQCRDERGALALAFGTGDSLRSANQLDVPGRQQFEHTLVESEIAYGILDRAILNVPKTVAREAGKQRRARVHPADVPEPAYEQTALHAANHLSQARRRSGAFDNGIDWTRRGRLALVLR